MQYEDTDRVVLGRTLEIDSRRRGGQTEPEYWWMWDLGWIWQVGEDHGNSSSYTLERDIEDLAG